MANESFYEWYGKATYTINDQWAARRAGILLAVGRPVPARWLVTSTGNVTYTAPSTWFPANSGLGGYISADLGYWDLGTSDAFYGTGVAGIRSVNSA